MHAACCGGQHPICGGLQDVASALRTYHYLSERWFTHASPTLFNAGTPRPQLSSCFLVAMKNDSIEVRARVALRDTAAMARTHQTGQVQPSIPYLSQGIYDTLKECAAISKSAGGIGLSIHNIRAVGSYIRGTNGTSNGIVPMLRVFNDTARWGAVPLMLLLGSAHMDAAPAAPSGVRVRRYVDQGGGKRKGAFAIYLEPWHADIFDWLELRKNHGKEEVGRRTVLSRNAARFFPACAPSWGRCVAPGACARPVLRPVDDGPLHAARGGERGLEPLLPQ